MRTSETYNKLIEGYAFSLGLLKKFDKEMYELFLDTHSLLQSCGSIFSQLVRDLRIDFAKGNDAKEIQDPQLIELNKGFVKDIRGITYQPAYDYCLSLYHETQSMLGKKKKIYMLYPVTPELIKMNGLEGVAYKTRVDDDGKVMDTTAYLAGFSDDGLEIIRKINNNPKRVKNVLTVPESEIAMGEEYMKLF